MNFGTGPIIVFTKKQLINNDDVTKESLIRFAKYLGLKYDLDTMSKRQLVKLIFWKMKKDHYRDNGGWYG